MDIKKGFEHKTQITKDIIENVKKIRKETYKFNKFLFEKYSVILTIINGLGEVEYEDWKENIEFLDKVNKYT